MVYNISLFFNQKTNKEIHKLYSEIKDGLNSYPESKDNFTPHATIIKFGSSAKLTKKQLAEINKIIKKEIDVRFSGLTILPSKNEGYWVEISILKNQRLSEIQKELIKELKNCTLISGVRDDFRPHITLAWVKNGIVDTKKLYYLPLRKKKVCSKIIIKEYE